MKGSNSRTTIMYTDGSCEPNPGNGGWAALLLRNGKEYIYKGHEQNTTNNRMELKAAIEGLKHANTNERIEIFTDSQYLKRGIEEWLENWIARNWKRKGGKLKNVDLWKELADLINDRDIKWYWVKGHSGDSSNERVDRLARMQTK